MSVLLSGCVGMAGMAGGYAKAYDGNDRSDAQLATLYTAREGSMFAEVKGASAMLSQVDDRIVGDDLFKGYPKVTKVLPGRHRLVSKCFALGSQVAFPAWTATLEAGHYYQLTCEDMGNGYASASHIDRGMENPIK